MRAVIVVAFVAGACFDRPDYENATFKCDDTHGCVAGQTCLAGLCTYIASTYDGVMCGEGPCGVGSNTDKPQCCFNGTQSFCIRSTEECGGSFSEVATLCDGAEDCPSGTTCCLFGAVGACTKQACDDRFCQDASDCGAFHFCCPDPSTLGAPFSRCAQDACAL